MNISLRYDEAFLSRKFDFLYRATVSALKGQDPCAIKGGSCFSMRQFPERHKDDPFCCKGCKYLKADGCSVETLYCKLWFCSAVENSNQVKADGMLGKGPLQVKLEKIKKVAGRYNLLVFRGSKEDSVKQAMELKVNAPWMVFGRDGL